MRRFFVVAAVAAAAFVLAAAPASAHCTFDLDRQRTTRGGEFYAHGSMVVGDYVEIHWGSRTGPVIDSFVVGGAPSYAGPLSQDTGQASYRRRLETPRNAEFGWAWVVAVVDPHSGQPEYTFTRSIQVEDPSATAAAEQSPAAPEGPGDHTPVAAYPPLAAQPQTAPATQPSAARVPARVPVARAVAQPAEAPAEAAQPSWQWDRAGQWSRSGAKAPVAVPPPAGDGRSPTTSGLSEALRSVAAGGPWAVPSMSLAMALAAAFVAARRPRRMQRAS